MSRENLWAEWAAKHAKKPIVIERWGEAGMWHVRCGDLSATAPALQDAFDSLLRIVVTGHLEPQ